MRKVYTLPGKVAGTVTFIAGKVSVQCNFDGGNIDKKMNRPATYATSDIAMQMLIENSSVFGSTVFLEGDNIRTLAPKSTAPKPKKKATETETPTPNVEVVEDVVTLADAVALLKAKGVAASELRTIASVKASASSLNLSFPNLN